MTPGLTALSDWGQRMEVGLAEVLRDSMNIMGHDAEKTCRRAVAFMAESASKITKVAEKKRIVRTNPHFVHLMRKSQYKKARIAGKDMRRYYQYESDKLTQQRSAMGVGSAIRHGYGNDSERLSLIQRRKLAKHSWQWGIGKRPAGGPRMPEGITEFYPLHGGSGSAGYMTEDGVDTFVAGYVLDNKLSYIDEAMPPGWKADVERKAINRIMAIAAKRVERDWRNHFSGISRGISRAISRALR